MKRAGASFHGARLLSKSSFFGSPKDVSMMPMPSHPFFTSACPLQKSVTASASGLGLPLVSMKHFFAGR